MAIRATLVYLFGIGPTREIARAQVEALRQRVPVLYAVLGINVVALANTHWNVNAAWQVFYFPAALVIAILLRIVAWVRLRPSRLTDREVQATRRKTVILGGALGVLVLIWAMTLRQSPDLPRISGVMTDADHSVFFVCITIVSSIMLLMHHRLAALTIGITVLVPFATFLFYQQRSIETAIGFNLLLVSAAILYVAVTFSQHFDQSVVAAADLLRLSAQNARLAASDVLTALPNRRQFFRELEAAGASRDNFAVIVCDLDGFKQANEVFGHHAGDEILCQIADRLTGAVPAGCFVARMGSNEFTCILLGQHAHSAGAVADRMIAVCREIVVGRAFTAQIGASAGICHSALSLEPDWALAYERAGYALLRAKSMGRGCVVTFNQAHDLSMRRDSLIAHQLQSADMERELWPVFQPVVDATTFEIRSFEALIRWTSPVLGAVHPQEFIPIAEQTDLIFQVSRLVVRSALRQALQWPDSIRVKVNLSVRDLMSSHQTRALVAELQQSAVAPDRVTFEITETILAESIEQIRANVDVLRASGCQIAVDDFGVGYSSLNYIHMLAPDVIKIDRCFIEQVAANETTRRIVRTIVELARNVGAKTVAEGVETAEQAHVLAGLGCDELQGYLFSEPVSAEASVELARRRWMLVDSRALFAAEAS